MDYQQFVDSLSPDVVDRLRKGVETGRWPDGTALTPEQREHSLQAVIAWEEKHLPAEQRVGFIDKGAKADKADATSTLTWVDQPSGSTESSSDE